MSGVPREPTEHRLRVDSKVKLVKEHLRRSSVQKGTGIGKEIARLLAAEVICEVYRSEWLGNVVMVLKKNNSLRMCINSKHFNQAFPKDHFPLPCTDQIVDSTTRCEHL